MPQLLCWIFLGICIFHVLNSVQKVTINCKDKRLEIDIKLKLITNVNNILFFFIDMHKVYNTYFEYSRIHFTRLRVISARFFRARLWWTFYDELVSSILFFWFSLETSRIIVVIMGKFTFFHFQDKKLNDERFLQAESFLEKKNGSSIVSLLKKNFSCGNMWHERKMNDCYN